MVTDVDAEQGDVKVDFRHPHGPQKTFNWPQNGIPAMTYHIYWKIL